MGTCNAGDWVTDQLNDRRYTTLPMYKCPHVEHAPTSNTCTLTDIRARAVQQANQPSRICTHKPTQWCAIFHTSPTTVTLTLSLHRHPSPLPLTITLHHHSINLTCRPQRHPSPVPNENYLKAQHNATARTQVGQVRWLRVWVWG